MKLSIATIEVLRDSPVDIDHDPGDEHNEKKDYGDHIWKDG